MKKIVLIIAYVLNVSIGICGGIIVTQGDCCGGGTGGAVNCTDVINCVPKYVDSVYRKTAIDSIYWYKNGVEYAIKDSVGSGGIGESIDTVSINYADFYTLITNNQLIVGNTYIIMDFQTVYDQMDFDNSGSLKGTLTTKTGGIEEIWVLALAPDRIADKAYSKTYPNDKIQYDWTYNATLVNGSPAKGRITERIDEWNNRTDYDHREIKFIRYDDGAGNFTVINDNGNASQEFLTFGNTYGTNTGEIIKNNYIGDYYTYNSFYGQEYSNNVIHATSFCVGNIFGIVCFNNTWGDYNSSNTFGDDNYSNTFGDYNYSNTFGNYNYSNTFGNDNHSNTFGNSNNSNTFGDGNYSNTFGDNNYSNTFDTTQTMLNKVFGSYIQNKDFTLQSYMYGNDYEVKIFKASDGNIYSKYFDGTNDINTLIP